MAGVVDGIFRRRAHLRPGPPRGGRSPEERLEALEQKIRRLEEQDEDNTNRLRLLQELRGRDHLARVAAFTGGFSAVSGAFNNTVQAHTLCYDVSVKLIPEALGLDPRYNPSCTVRFCEGLDGAFLSYDGEILGYKRLRLRAHTIDETGARYEIKHVARRYMLEHTEFQHPDGKVPAAYSLF